MAKTREEVIAEVDAESDHCTGVPEFYAECCRDHDIHYRLRDVSRREADAEFRRCIQAKSPLKKFSPLSWWRWTGVRLFGWIPWRRHGDGSDPT